MRRRSARVGFGCVVAAQRSCEARESEPGGEGWSLHGGEPEEPPPLPTPPPQPPPPPPRRPPPGADGLARSRRGGAGQRGRQHATQHGPGNQAPLGGQLTGERTGGEDHRALQTVSARRAARRTRPPPPPAGPLTVSSIGSAGIRHGPAGGARCPLPPGVVCPLPVTGKEARRSLVLQPAVAELAVAASLCAALRSEPRGRDPNSPDSPGPARLGPVAGSAPRARNVGPGAGGTRRSPRRGDAGEVGRRPDLGACLGAAHGGGGGHLRVCGAGWRRTPGRLELSYCACWGAFRSEPAWSAGGGRGTEPAGKATRQPLKALLPGLKFGLCKSFTTGCSCFQLA